MAQSEALEKVWAAEEVADLSIWFAEKFQESADKTVEDEEKRAEAAGMVGDLSFFGVDVENEEN